MTEKAKRFRCLEFFLLFTSILLFVLFIGYLDHALPVISLGERIPILLVLPFLAGGMLLLMKYPGLKREATCLRAFLSVPEFWKYMLLLLIFWVPRSVLWLNWPSSIESDYALYVKYSGQYAASGSFIVIDFLVKIAPNITVYCAVLGLVMRIFGAGIATAQWFCMFLNACNILLLYAAAKRLTTPARAFVAAALFALLPENVFYSVLPGIEAISLFTILLGLLLVFSIPDKKPAVQILLALGGGLLLALSACIRASAWAAVIAAAVWMLLRLRLPLRKILIVLAAFAVGLAGSWLWHRSFQNRMFPGEKPVSGIGWPLYEGLNLDGGGWTAEKAARRDEVIAAYSAEDSDRIFREEALARFSSYSFSEKIHMFGRKGGIVWFEPGYAVFLIPDKTTSFTCSHIVTFGLFLCLALWIAGMISRVLKPMTGTDRAACALCLIIILLTTLWHEFGTSISRYRYMMMPFVILMTAVCLPAEAGRLRLPRFLTGIFRKNIEK